MSNKDGWEFGWCGKCFIPLHATSALKHELKIKKGVIAPVLCSVYSIE